MTYLNVASLNVGGHRIGASGDSRDDCRCCMTHWSWSDAASEIETYNQVLCTRMFQHLAKYLEEQNATVRGCVQNTTHCFAEGKIGLTSKF